MNRLRLADVKTPLARVINTCAADPIVIDYANEAHRRLVAKGKFLGTVQRYRICTSASGCLTWPRQIETIEAWWICDSTGQVRNGWYENNINGPGLQSSEDGMVQSLIDRGTSCVFDEIDGIVSKVMVQADVAEDSDAQLLIRGYDENANWIRTEVNGEWIEGEYVTIGTLAHYTANLITKITEVIKPVTNGPVRLWQYDTTLATATKALAYYEPDETLPIYRCSIIPGLGFRNGCGGSNSTDCSSNQITVIAKLQHIDVRVDNDFFLLGNLAALKLMVMAILKEERNLFSEALAYEAKAIKELQDELSSYEGDGAVATVKTESRLTWGAGVLNTVSPWPSVYY